MIPSHMTSTEKRAAFSLACIFAIRMLGLFMILPVFTPYAHQLEHATPFLIGAALGIYGFSQALLQIPFGALSDRIGRKPVITTGLVIFAVGSMIAALSHSIYGVMLGRALQGTGAIGSTTIAFVADLTHEDHRSKAMAIIGMVIGFSFMLAMVVGPVLNHWVGIPGIFGVTAGLALFGILLLFVVVPKPSHCFFHRDSEPLWRELPTILSNKNLLRLNFGIFVQHALLTAIFVVLPMLIHQAGLLDHTQWKIYLPILIFAFVFSLPLIIIGEKKRKIKGILLIGIAGLMLSQLGLWLFQHSLLGMALMLLLFFTAFTLLEAILPSLVSKIAPAGSKGTATGVYSTCQFLGIFFGGIVAGTLYQHYHITDVFWFCSALSLVWLFITLAMPKPRYVSSRLISISKVEHLSVNTLKDKLLELPGVLEAVIAKEEHAAYLKIDKDIFEETKLQCLLHSKKQS